MYVICLLIIAMISFLHLKLTENEQYIARDVLKEIKERLRIFNECWIKLSSH